MDRALVGEIDDLEAEIQNEINAWQEYQPSINEEEIGENVMTFLGMTFEEYSAWFSGSSPIKNIIEGRHVNQFIQDLWQGKVDLVDIFRWFDKQFKDGKFERCNLLFSEIDPSKLDEDTIVAFLCSTYCSKHLCPNREQFANDAQKYLAGIIGAEKAFKLIREIR